MMLNTPTINQFDPQIPGVFAFRIHGEVPKDDMKALADYMNDAFDALDEVDMLFVFEAGGGATTGARFDPEVIKSQFRSLNKVRNYVAAGAPDRAEKMLQTFAKVLPVNAEVFDTEEEALAYLRRQEQPA